MPSQQPFASPTAQPFAAPSSQPTGSSYFTLQPRQRRFKQYFFLFGTAAYSSTNKILFQDIDVTEGQLGKNIVIYGSKTNPGTINMNLNVNTNQSFVSFSLLPYGQAHDSRFRSIEVVKDVNGDPYDDLLVGDPLSSIVYVLYGNTGVNQVYSTGKGYQIIGETTSDYLGWSVSGAGDMNNDGINDMIISAILADKVYIIFGVVGIGKRNNVLLSTLKPTEGIRIIGSSPLSSVGMSVSSIGDFNHDGRADIAISATTTSLNFIYILYGNNSLPAIVNLNQYRGNMTTVASNGADFAGTTMSGLGDVNGDGIDDFIIGSVSRAGLAETQKSFVLYGQRSIVPEIRLDQLTISQGFQVIGGGMGVSGIGDINGDGLNDFMVNSFNNWQGQSASYIMVFPNKVTLSPSTAPSLRPSTVSPVHSVSPTRATVAPTDTPSFLSTSSNFSSSPTNSLVPSVSPSLLPSSITPSMLPTATLIPSFVPSVTTTLIPSFLPSVKPVNSLRPVRSPTPLPSFRPSTEINSPSSSPSIYPTYSSNSFTTVTEITSGGIIDGTNWTKVEIRVNSPLNVVIITAGDTVNKFTICPQPNVTIIFHNFNVFNLLDLSLFPTLSKITELSYSLNPLTILLPDDQKLIFPEIIDFDLNGHNFIFADISEDSASSTSKKRKPSSFSFDDIDLTNSFQRNLALFIIVFVCISLALTCICRRKRFSKDESHTINGFSRFQRNHNAILPSDNPNLNDRRNKSKRYKRSQKRGSRDIESHGVKMNQFERIIEEDDESNDSSNDSNNSSRVDRRRSTANALNYDNDSSDAEMDHFQNSSLLRGRESPEIAFYNRVRGRERLNSEQKSRRISHLSSVWSSPPSSSPDEDDLSDLFDLSEDDSEGQTRRSSIKHRFSGRLSHVSQHGSDFNPASRSYGSDGHSRLTHFQDFEGQEDNFSGNSVSNGSIAHSSRVYSRLSSPTYMYERSNVQMSDNFFSVPQYPFPFYSEFPGSQMNDNYYENGQPPFEFDGPLAHRSLEETNDYSAEVGDFDQIMRNFSMFSPDHSHHFQHQSDGDFVEDDELLSFGSFSEELDI
jgi:hypothetical protein